MRVTIEIGRVACETGGNREQVRCERVRDPAAGWAPPAVRGPLAGGGPQQVKVVHQQEARRQLPRRAGPRCPDGPGVRSADRRADRMEPPGTRDRHLVPGGHRVHGDGPYLAARSRASAADALATVTPALTRPDARDRPDPRELRTVLYQHAFNPARPAGPGSAAAQILGWAQQASLPVGCLSEPAVLRTALEALTFRLDGSRAAASTVIRKRAVLHGALGYAAESGLLPDNPGPGTASRSCSPSTATASMAKTTSSTSRSATSSNCPQNVVRARPWKASGCTDRATGTDAVRYASVDSPPGPPTARGPRRHQTDTPRNSNPSDNRLSCSKKILEQDTNSDPLPGPAHGWPTASPTVCGTARPGRKSR